MTSPQLKSDKNYTILRPLGGGNFGTVYKIRVHEDNKEYAVKNIMLNRPEALAEAKMEYKLLREGIPNVLKSFGSYHQPNKMFLFSTELMEKNLQDYIKENKGPLPFKKFIPIFKNIITGRISNFFFFENKNVYKMLSGLWGLFESTKTIHRDLKPENILINDRGEAFIADLDAAKIYNSFTSAKRLSDITFGVGTPKWMSPEMRAAFSTTVTTELPKSDIFSLGLIVLFCIDTPTFEDKLSPILSQFTFKMKEQEVRVHLKNLESNLLDYLEDFRLRNLNSPSIINIFYLLKSMLSFSPCARPSIQQLYEDFPVLSSILV